MVVPLVVGAAAAAAPSVAGAGVAGAGATGVGAAGATAGVASGTTGAVGATAKSVVTNAVKEQVKEQIVNQVAGNALGADKGNSQAQSNPKPDVGKENNGQGANAAEQMGNKANSQENKISPKTQQPSNNITEQVIDKIVNVGKDVVSAGIDALKANKQVGGIVKAIDKTGIIDAGVEKGANMVKSALNSGVENLKDGKMMSAVKELGKNLLKGGLSPKAPQEGMSADQSVAPAVTPKNISQNSEKSR